LLYTGQADGQHTDLIRYQQFNSKRNDFFGRMFISEQQFSRNLTIASTIPGDRDSFVNDGYY
jgi:hypothetical protein